MPNAGYRLLNGRFTKTRPSTGPITEMSLRCGVCPGCKLDKVREWQCRMICESFSHSEMLFMTLTYDDDHMPAHGSLCREDYRLFRMRFRKRLGAKKIRAFACGEYGELTGRAHYHLIAYGVGVDDFSDANFCKMSGDNRLYKSSALDELWGKGMCNFGRARPGSMGYVAGYVTKKLGTANDDARYARVDPVSGETVYVEREFGSMSPGLGRDFINKYRSDFAFSGFLVFEGRKYAIPHYFKKKLRGTFETSGALKDGDVVIDDLDIAMRKARELAATPEAEWNNSPERLRAREESFSLRAQHLVRDRFRDGHE